MATEARLSLMVEAIDRASRVLQQTAQQLKVIGTSADQTNAKTKKMSAEGVAGANRFSASLVKLEVNLKKISAAGASITSMGTRLAGAGAAFAATAFFPIKAAGSFEKAMSKVKAVTAETGASYDDLKVKAAELGRTTKFTAAQAADGMRFLGMAGLEAGKVLDAIGPALSLAAAGELELAEASDIATDIMSAFGKTTAELPEIMDMLAFTAANSNTDIRQLADAMRYVAPTARAAGVTLAETAARIGVLSSNGIKASMAGTSLRGAMIGLLAPTPKAEKVLKELGIEVEKNEKGQIKLAAVFRDLAKAGITAEQAVKLFRRTAMGGAIVMANSAVQVDKFTQAIEKSEGAALKMQTTMEENLFGAFIKFTSAVTGLMIALGDPLLGPLKEVTESITAFATSIADWVEKNPGFAKALTGTAALLGGVTLAAGAVLIPLGFLIQAVAFASAGFVKFGLSLATVPAKLGAARAAINATTGAAATLTATLAPLAAIWGLFKIGEAVGAFIEMRKAQNMLEEQSKRLVARSQELIDKWGAFKEKIYFPEDVTKMAREDLKKTNTAVWRSTAYWLALKNQLGAVAKETTIFGNYTAKALAAQKELEYAEQKLKELGQMRKLISEQMKKISADEKKLVDLDVKDKPKKATEEELEARWAALEESARLEISLMQDKYVQLDALQAKEIADFKKSDAVKVLSAEEVQKRITLITTKYSLERASLYAGEAEVQAAQGEALAERQLVLEESRLDRQIALLDEWKTSGLISTEEYWSERTKIAVEKSQQEIALLQLMISNANASEAMLLKIDVQIAEEDLAAELSEIDAAMQAAQTKRAQDEITRAQILQSVKIRIARTGLTDWAAIHDEEESLMEQRHAREMQALIDLNAGKAELNELFREQELEKEQKFIDDMGEILGGLADVTKSALDLLGQYYKDMYDKSGGENKKYARRAKKVAIATAIIDTMLSATKAFNSLASIPYVGSVLGAAAAALAVAAGMRRVSMIRNQRFASGGEVLGHSPHSRADNIPIDATAGEFMQPVPAVKYYGKGIMESMRRMLIPRELLKGHSVPVYSAPVPRKGYAAGGPVAGGRGITPPKETEQPQININNIIDPQLMGQYTSSKPGQRNIMNVLTQNQFQLKQIVLGE